MHTVQAIAVVIANPQDASLVLIARGPEDDDDLPGIWGLSATSIKLDESDADAAHRLRTRKLGAELTLNAVLAEGNQDRRTYQLAMRLYTASHWAPAPQLPEPENHIDDSTYYTEWKWAPRDSLREGARMESLCCQLTLQSNQQESV
tara:strand:- start:511 stop:951 length:441 start_codon:yes stop_codon:yes gene_type:complete